MKINLSQNLRDLSQVLQEPLYVVGGYVRNYLAFNYVSEDIDLASSNSSEMLKSYLDRFGFKVLAEYKRTGTIMFSDGRYKYEYTTFRRDSYTFGGKHTPDSVEFTASILEDALRRDFKCNAVYYDIKNDEFVDPLGGIDDISNRKITTVKDPNEVFKSDGLRLMRLARFAGELGFSIDKDVVDAGKKFASNIQDISAERIYDELEKILISDKKYPFSDKAGHYIGLKILSEMGVLDYILPELTLGRGMPQRSDFHNYDVLEHSLRCVLYSAPSIRLFALLHDIGKPYQMINNGKFYNHESVGSVIAKKVLTRLKADKKTIDKTEFMTKYHMYDLNGEVREGKLKRFLVENYNYIDDLLLLKQADYSACKDDLSVCKTIIRWKETLKKMKEEGVPFSIKDLPITAKDLQDLGYNGSEIGRELKKLFYLAIDNPKADLVKIAIKDKN